ncbi:hypothetical protein EB796_010945 [Bugula neritina]|uniref:Uncharacterized protein n=1 Tax=Bugula neritina TaxID=10212 RepID=A0A7J7JYG5_BUGNE|nr:hypothetical protein EB796_010945 [Bugula neritina]
MHIVSLSNLHHLDISNAWYILRTPNQITCLPDNFSQLSSLRHLNLSGNNTLKVLTPEIADMPLLTKIDTDRCESLTKVTSHSKIFSASFPAAFH